MQVHAPMSGCAVTPAQAQSTSVAATAPVLLRQRKAAQAHAASTLILRDPPYRLSIERGNFSSAWPARALTPNRLALVLLQDLAQIPCALNCNSQR
jgi:hypothetical protein